MSRAFAELLANAADETDKKFPPAYLALLRETYDFFKQTGFTDDAIQKMMGLTSHHMRLVTQRSQ